MFTGENKLYDPNLCEFYDKVRLITRGPIFNIERIKTKTIIKMNIGIYKKLIDKYVKSPQEYELKVYIEDVKEPKAEGTKWCDENNIIFYNTGLRVITGKIVKAKNLKIGLNHNADYKILFYNGDQTLNFVNVSCSPYSIDKGLDIIRVAVLENAYNNGFGSIKIIPYESDFKMYSMGHLLLY